jgi:hypothetical protein
MMIPCAATTGKGEAGILDVLTMTTRGEPGAESLRGCRLSLRHNLSPRITAIACLADPSLRAVMRPSRPAKQFIGMGLGCNIQTSIG